MIFIISFDSTHHAIAAECALDGRNASRLVPLHPSISAGCGLALRYESDSFEEVPAFLKIAQIPFAAVYHSVAPGKYEVVP